MKTDFFLCDAEQLNKLASTETVKQGLACFTENRVFVLDAQDKQLSTQVEGSTKDQPYWVELSINSDNELLSQCDCGSEEKICKHAIASLYSYAEFCLNTEVEGFGSAVDEAIKERVKKGRNEVSVKLLSGNLAFGVWQAKSIISATYQKTAYHVYIRSLDRHKNYCTCPDLATNRLGTCKHIESVLHYAKKQSEYDQLVSKGVPVSFVYLAWESATDPVIRLHKAEQCEQGLLDELAEYFAHDNQFKGRLPDDFNYFAQKFNARDDLLIGDDALLFVRQSAEDAAHQLRAKEISQQIIQANGVLAGIKVRLFSYQTEGVAFLASRGRALLADDIGLGKTLQAISAASWLADHAGVKKVLVVCPPSLKHQWAREIEKFTNRKVQIIQGAIENRQVQYRADTLFYIVNYELILRDLSVISETLKPDLLILDEAQRIKNWRTKIASTVKLIPSRYVFVLTGTPLENRIEDLYSLLQVVDVRVLGPLWRCLLDFHVTDETGKVIGYRNLSELRRRISSVMLRRNRTLVGDQLPQRTEVCLDIPMTKVQQEIHGSAMSSAGQLANIAKRRALTPSESNRLMASLQQARMACNAAGLVDKITIGSPKLDELSRLLEELCLQSNRKVVIFSQWVMMTQMVESLVKSLALGCVHLHGGVAKQKREALMDEFQNNDAIQVFISTDGGAVGLNLVAASALINLDMPWNPAILDQRIARIHRLGQQKVQLFLLLAEDSYEQHVAKLVKAKRDLFDNVISPDATEDVGVSKKMLQSIIDDLTEAESNTQPSERTEELLPVSQENSQINAVSSKPAENDNEVNCLISKIQQNFGHRIQQILASGDGLLVVLNQLEPADDDSAQALSEVDLPVVVIAVKTLSELQRLGTASPLSDAKVITDQNDGQVENPLFKVAQDKLKSAEILIEQQCYAGVLEILAGSLLAIASALSEQKQIPPLEKATVWLYSEVQPQQLMTVEQINTIVKVIALSQNIDLPNSLIEQALLDTQTMLGQYEAKW
ncbi:MAG: DEAD/DEAH box helicase [Methylococcales symbiont of Hymedesmia sp. n. MRB-2018]|nr:MAG: DEAD/DEAH box helicase [Methylococcales symbiont of Hymedesmia sp. n. MRB-2018]